MKNSCLKEKKSECEREEERKSERRRSGGESGRVMESFAFLENIIDRLELIGARDNWPALVALVCFCSNSRCERAFCRARGRATGKRPLISARRAERIQPGIYSHNNSCVIAVLDLKCMHFGSPGAGAVPTISINDREERMAWRLGELNVNFLLVNGAYVYRLLSSFSADDGLIDYVHSQKCTN